MTATRTDKKRVQVDGLTLLWGNTVEWKAELRDEALRKHLARPIAERLQAALELVLPSERDRRR
jgi:hypothetical protein